MRAPRAKEPAVTHLLQQYGLALAALVVFAAELDIPTVVPVEVILLLTGSYVIDSWAELLGSLALLALVDLLGTLALYAAGRWGSGLLRHTLLRAGYQHAEQRFASWDRRLRHHDIVLVFLGHLVPGLRMSVAPGAGLLRFPLSDMVVGTLPGALLWVGIPLSLGYLFRDELARLIRVYGDVGHIALIASVVLAVLGIAWVLHHLHRSRAEGEGGSTADG